MPSDIFQKLPNPYDTETSYYGAYTIYPQGPSPYKNNGSSNSEYSKTSANSSTENALSDFYGLENSKVLCLLATAQTNWKTDASIINNSEGGYSPAACCCWRYHTEGTQQGDWYLPSCGELGYMMSRISKINNAINTLINNYGNSCGIIVDISSMYWSSSEYGSYYAMLLDTSSGSIGELGSNYQKDAHLMVRAFMRI